MLEQTFDFPEIATQRSGVNAAVHDLGVRCLNSRCIYASRWVVGIGRVPFRFARWDPVVQYAVLEKLGEALARGSIALRLKVG